MTGAQLRDAGQDAVIAADVAAQRQHGDLIRWAIDLLARYRSAPWTCDDVRAIAADVAEGRGVDFNPSPNLLPALMGVAVGRGDIVRLPRDVNSTRRSRHASRVGTYLGARFAPPATGTGHGDAGVEGGRGGRVSPTPTPPESP